MSYGEIWTSATGKQFEAEFQEKDKNNLIFKMPNGLIISFKSTQLDADSQDRVKNILKYGKENQGNASRLPPFHYTPILLEKQQSDPVEKIDIQENDDSSSNSAKNKGTFYSHHKIKIFARKAVANKIYVNEATQFISDINTIYNALYKINRELGLFYESVQGEFDFDSRSSNTTLCSYNDKQSIPVFNIANYASTNKRGKELAITQTLVQDILTKNDVSKGWVYYGLQSYFNDFFTLLDNPASLQASLKPKAQVVTYKVPSMARLFAPNPAKNIFDEQGKLLAKYVVFYCLHMKDKQGIAQFKNYIYNKCLRLSDLFPRGTNCLELESQINKAFEPYGIQFNFEPTPPNQQLIIK